MELSSSLGSGSDENISSGGDQRGEFAAATFTAAAFASAN